MNTSAVDHVFAVLGATYGASWDRSLGSSPISDVKTVWGSALDDFCQNDNSKRAIMWALQNLPDTVPNSRQFRTLCRQAPTVEAPMLPAPVVNREIAARVLGSLQVAAVKVDPKAWAKAILLDVRGGLKRNPTSVRMAKDALGQE